MIVLESPDFIFLTTGKIGTQTLSTVPEIVNHSRNENYYGSLSSRAMDMAINLQNSKNKQLIILVRDPISRFNSGLFEIIAKLTYQPFIRLLQDTSPLFDPTFWVRPIDDCLRLSPRVWNSKEEFSSHRWQYHVGNWLTYAEQIADSIDNCKIVDLTNLSSFLQSNKISFLHINKYTDILPNEEDAKKVFSAFHKSFEYLPSRKKQIFDYLVDEQQTYKRLLNRGE